MVMKLFNELIIKMKKTALISVRISWKTFKVLSLLIVAIFAILTSCEKQLEPVNDITVSQGTYFGVVHLNWTPVADAHHYHIHRMGPDGQWLDAGSINDPPFDDYGFNLPDNKLAPGVRYQYRISSESNDIKNSDYSPVSGEGWSYEIKPIEIQAQKNDNGSVTISWTDPNAEQLQKYNLYQCSYKLVRGYEGQGERYDSKLTDITISSADETDKFTYTRSNPYDNENYFVEATYSYTYKNYDSGTMEESCKYTTERVTATSSGDGTEITYNTTSLNDIPRANSGCGWLELKNINNTIYASIITNPSVGKPVVYKLNGTSWSNISNAYPEGLQKNFERISIAGDGSNVWVAGISDSAYVYSLNNSVWSGNLASNNLGLADKPEELMVEYFNNKLYALCDHDNKLELYSYSQNSTWNSVSVIENNDGIMNLGFKVFNSKLYVCYTTMISDQNSTLKIKHFDGSSWQTDFDKAYDYISDIDVYVDNSDKIYFSSGTLDMNQYAGNVYKVTSTSSADEMVGSDNQWLSLPDKIASDDYGNPVVIYSKYISETQGFEQHLAVYDSGEWKKIAGDYSGSVRPADIELNGELYFVYGDGHDLINYYPATFKALSLKH